MTPLLVFLFGFKPSVAVGTDLLYAAITKTSGVWVHHGKHGSVEWHIVGWLALGSLPFALATLYVLKHLMSVGKEITGMITYSLGIALILTACALLVRSVLLRLKKNQEIDDEHSSAENSGRFSPRWEKVATVATGAVLGVLVTLSSVGAGALGTVALLFLYPRMATVKVVGTDIAHAVPLTLVAGLGHASLGSVDWDLLAKLLAGSLPGIWLGSRLIHKAPERLLRSMLSVLLAYAGTKLMATLLNELERTGGRYGLQTMCEGGGLANVTIVERL